MKVLINFIVKVNVSRPVLLVILTLLSACSDGDPATGVGSTDATISLLDGGSPGDIIASDEDGGVSNVDAQTENCTATQPATSCNNGAFRPCTASEGTNGATLVFGTIILGDGLICDGSVLFDKNSGEILCVGEDCQESPLATEASVLCADIVLPGLIDSQTT